MNSLSKRKRFATFGIGRRQVARLSRLNCTLSKRGAGPLARTLVEAIPATAQEVALYQQTGGKRKPSGPRIARLGEGA